MCPEIMKMLWTRLSPFLDDDFSAQERLALTEEGACLRLPPPTYGPGPSVSTSRIPSFSLKLSSQLSRLRSAEALERFPTSGRRDAALRASSPPSPSLSGPFGEGSGKGSLTRFPPRNVLGESLGFPTTPALRVFVGGEGGVRMQAGAVGLGRGRRGGGAKGPRPLLPLLARGAWGHVGPSP